MTDQSQSNDINSEAPAIKSEPLDDFDVEFGSSSCIKIETVHGFEIKCEVDEEQVVDQYPPASENFDSSLVKCENPEEEEEDSGVINETVNNLVPGSAISGHKFDNLMGNSIFIQQGSAESAIKTSEIIENSISSPKNTAKSQMAALNPQIRKKIVVKRPVNIENQELTPKPEPNAKSAMIINQSAVKIPRSPQIMLKNSQILKISPGGLKISHIGGQKGTTSSLHPAVTIKTEPNPEDEESDQMVSQNIDHNLKIDSNTQKAIPKIVKISVADLKALKSPTIVAKLPQNLTNIIKIPQASSTSPESSKTQEVSSKLHSILAKTREALLKVQNSRVKPCKPADNSKRIPKFVDASTELNLTPQKPKPKFYQIPQLAPKIPETSSNIAIKEEPVDPDQLIPEIKIKEEPTEDPDQMENYTDDNQESIFSITEVKTELEDDDDQYFYPSTVDKPESSDASDDLFQYNVVNSFKTDLSTRRCVSHTVVTEGREKSQEEVMELARKELMKLEQEKQYEKDRSAAGGPVAVGPKGVAIGPKAVNVGPRAVAVPLNVNGTRIVTRIVMPNVEKGLMKNRRPGRPPVEAASAHQCPVCLIKFKTIEQLVAHKRLHDTGKAKLNTAEMTRNVYLEVKMKIEQIGNRKSIHVLLPNYDYAFIVTNSTANKLYMKCFRQTCDVKAYSTNDGKFYLKQGDRHCHGPDREVILTKITEAKMCDLEKSSVINRQVHAAIIEKQKEKTMMEERKTSLIDRIKRSQVQASGSGIVKKRRLS